MKCSKKPAIPSSPAMLKVSENPATVLNYFSAVGPPKRSLGGAPSSVRGVGWASPLTLPLAGCVEDFHLQVSAPCRAHQKRNRAVGPGFGSAGCDAFTSHGAAGSENGGRGSRPLVHLAPAKCSKERGNMRKRRSNYGASVKILCSRFNGICNLKK